MTVLTSREIEVMILCVQGLGTKEIADRMGISEHTTKFHLTNAMKKFKSTTRTRAAVLFTLEREAEVRELMNVP